MRPQLTSRPVVHIVDEVCRLVDNGFREVILTGIHLGHYGVDWNRRAPKSRWIRLSDLVRRLAQLPGDFRIRLSSIEATEATRELVEVMADHGGKIAPHLHISMQSGSDSVLRRMRRRWGSRRFVDRCNFVKERLDEPAITTDIIVGFPGESEMEFSETVAVAREVGFSKIHLFPFSARRGTPAATMPDQIPKHVKQSRVGELEAVEAELRDAYCARLRGRTLRVLVEGQLADSGLSLGTACRYVPVELAARGEQAGEFVDVVAGEAAGGRIRAVK